MTDLPTQPTRRNPWGRPATAAAAAAWVTLAVSLGLDAASGVIWVMGFVVFFGSWLAAKAVTRNLAERPAHDVDEYEDRLRARARNIGYIGLAAGALLAMTVLAIAVRLDDNGSGWLLHLAPMVVAVSALPGLAAPTFWLAWAQQDDPEDLA